MVKPEQVLAHANDITKIIDTSVIFEVGVNSSDELRYFGSHSALDVELVKWCWSKTRLTSSSSLELTAIQLPVPS